MGIACRKTAPAVPPATLREFEELCKHFDDRCKSVDPHYKLSTAVQLYVRGNQVGILECDRKRTATPGMIERVVQVLRDLKTLEGMRSNSQTSTLGAFSLGFRVESNINIIDAIYHLYITAYALRAQAALLGIYDFKHCESDSDPDM